MLDKQTDSPTGRAQTNTDTLNQSQKHDCTLTPLDSVFKFRDEASSSCVHTLAEWKPVHVWHDSRESKRPSRWQQMAESSTGHVDTHFIACLRHGLCHRHFTSAYSVAHLLLLGWDVTLIPRHLCHLMVPGYFELPESDFSTQISTPICHVTTLYSVYKSSTTGNFA